MADDLLFGIDIGTTGAKAALYDREGQLQALGHAEYETHHIRPEWVEQSPEDWWQATCAAVRSALAGLPHAAERVAGIAVSSQAPALVPLDAAGQPVRPALIWMDRRAEVEAQEIAGLLGAGRVEQISGNRPDPFYVAAKLRWFARHEPVARSQTAIFAQVNGYVNLRLTGELTLDHSHAGLLQLRDRRSGEWSAELCDACSVTPGCFPTVSQGHALIGAVTRDAANATGLRPGTPVMAGTVDGAAAAVEAGAVAPGIAAEMTGTSTVLLMPHDGSVSEPAFIAMPAALPGVELVLGAMVASGAALRWFRDQFGLAELEAGQRLGLDTYDLLTLEAGRAAPGSGGVVFLPYMMGERAPIWHTHARGVFFGLSLATTRGELVRAILEGAAYALRHNVEVARAAGLSLREVRSVGGGTRSPLWNQIKADVLGLPIALPTTSVGAPFGGAVLTGMGLGWYPDPQASLRELVRITGRYEPDPVRHAAYTELYAIYRRIYEHLKDDFDALAAIRMQ
jgi:xylulokinase